MTEAPDRRPGDGHDHSWAEEMSEVRASCPDYNPDLAGTGIRCPGDPAPVASERPWNGSDWQEIGQVSTDHGPVTVHCRADGAVSFDFDRDIPQETGDREQYLFFAAAERDKLRDLLDRAAMPGQVPHAGQPDYGGMCAVPRDCPNGPDDHPFVMAERGRNWCTQLGADAPA